MTLRSKVLLTCTVGMLTVVFAGYCLIASESGARAISETGDTYLLADSSETHYEGAPDLLSITGDRKRNATTCDVCASDAADSSHLYPCQQHNLKHEGLYQGIEVGHNRWIHMACDEAHRSVQEGGGPFGAVIVQIDNDSNHVIRFWRCRNQVTKHLDPTAHAEVSAIRTVAKELGVFNLGEIRREDPSLRLPQPCEVSRCEIYSSCEPCPMCYAAIRWARIDTIVFAATRYDAAEPGVGFSDLELYQELDTPYADRHKTGLRVFQATTSNALDAFNLWKNTEKVAY